MKRFLLFLLGGIIAWVSMAWLNISEHPNFKIAGIVIASLLALAVVSVLFKAIIRLVKWMITSPAYLFLATTVLALLTGFSVIPVWYGVFSSTVISVLFVVSFIRYLAKSNQTIFLWLTGYKNLELKQRQNYPKSDISQGEQTLISLGFTRKEAREAFEYARDEKPDECLEEQVKCALEYLDKN